jgi:hypothetical protein
MRLTMSTRPSLDELVGRQASAPERGGEVDALIQELLDAHLDTVQMAADLEFDPYWRAYVEYLRTLHRKGCEVLASMTVAPA